MIEKNWQYRNKALKREDIESIARGLRIPAVFVTILMNRGIKTDEMLPFLKKSMRSIRM